MQDTLGNKFTMIDQRQTSLNVEREVTEENKISLIDYDTMRESDLIKSRATKI